MWFLKGMLLGLGLFFIGSLIYVGSKTGISAITAVTLHNVWLCFAKILCAPKKARIPWRDGCPIQVIPSPLSAKILSKSKARAVYVYI